MLGWIIIILFLLIMAVAIVGAVLLGFSMVYNRRDHKLRLEAEAHRYIMENTYDEIWEACKHIAGVPERFRTSFSDIYPNLINRDSDDDTLLNWLIDCNPDFDPVRYPELMDVIKEGRRKFVLHQARMMVVLEQHRQLLTNYLSSKLVRNKLAIVYVPLDTRYDRWGRPMFTYPYPVVSNASYLPYHHHSHHSHREKKEEEEERI